MCLFENYESQPENLKKICDFWIEKHESVGLNYKDCDLFLAQVLEIGFIFSYGLDAEPYDLKKI